MNKFLFSLALSLSMTSVAFGETMPRSTQVDKKLERQKLIEQREIIVADLVKNEAELDVLLRYADGDTFEDLIAVTSPAAGAATVGGALDLALAKKGPEALKAWLASLPKAVRLSLERLPSILGLSMATYIAVDAVWFKNQIDRLKGMDSNAVIAEHARLMSRRHFLSEKILLMDGQILALDLELARYE